MNPLQHIIVPVSASALVHRDAVAGPQRPFKGLISFHSLTRRYGAPGWCWLFHGVMVIKLQAILLEHV